MFEQVGLKKIVAKDFIENISFLRKLSWHSDECGINPYGRVLYFLKFPMDEYLDKRDQDIAWGLIIPVGDSNKLKEFILRKLDLKSSSYLWRVSENTTPSFISFHHKSSHISLGMDDNCLVVLSSWWSDNKNPEFLDDELSRIFNYGQNSNLVNSTVGRKLTGDDYDIGLSLLGKNFFESFSKNDEEEALYQAFKRYLSFDLNLKAKVDIDKVSLDGVFDYEYEVLEPGFGLKVASKLDQLRVGEGAFVLDSVYGEFLEIFLQRLDFQTASDLVSRIDLTNTTGFDQFQDLSANRRIRNERSGVIFYVSK